MSDTQIIDFLLSELKCDLGHRIEKIITSRCFDSREKLDDNDDGTVKFMDVYYKLEFKSGAYRIEFPYDDDTEYSSRVYNYYSIYDLNSREFFDCLRSNNSNYDVEITNDSPTITIKIKHLLIENIPNKHRNVNKITKSKPAILTLTRKPMIAIKPIRC